MRVIWLLVMVGVLSGCSVMIFDHDKVQSSVGLYDQTYDTFQRAKGKSSNLDMARKEVTVQIEEKTLIQNTSVEPVAQPIIPPQEEELK